MAAQCVGLSLLLLSCLLALATAAPVNPLTSSEVNDEALGKTLNQVQPNPLDFRPFTTQPAEDLTPPSGDNLDDDATISYVDASLFRKPADPVKPKASSSHKKAIPNFNKHSKEGYEMKKETVVPSEELQAPVDEKLFDVEINNKVAAILKVIRAIVQSENKDFADTVSSTDKNEEISTPSTTTVSTTTFESSTNEKSELPRLTPTTTTTTTTTTTEVSSSELTTSSSVRTLTNEDSELPRLSPPIWLHSSLAEAMSDPLRLPMIEPYDRYDRYSHSIARDVLW